MLNWWLSRRTTEWLLPWWATKCLLLVLSKCTSGRGRLLWLWTVSAKPGTCKIWLHGLWLRRLLLLLYMLSLRLTKWICALHAAVESTRWLLLLLLECLLGWRKGSLLWRHETSLLLRKLLSILSHRLLVLLDTVEEVYEIGRWSRRLRYRW